MTTVSRSTGALNDTPCESIRLAGGGILAPRPPRERRVAVLPPSAAPSARRTNPSPSSTAVATTRAHGRRGLPRLHAGGGAGGPGPLRQERGAARAAQALRSRQDATRHQAEGPRASTLPGLRRQGPSSSPELHGTGCAPARPVVVRRSPRPRAHRGSPRSAARTPTALYIGVTRVRHLSLVQTDGSVLKNREPVPVLSC